LHFVYYAPYNIHLYYVYYVDVKKIIYHVQDNLIITTSIPIAIPVNSEVESYTNSYKMFTMKAESKE